MTVEEALFILKHGSAEGLKIYLEAISVVEGRIKELEEKQTPKKVIKGGHVVSGNCPNCFDIQTADHNYCTDCGQALDWSGCE